MTTNDTTGAARDEGGLLDAAPGSPEVLGADAQGGDGAAAAPRRRRSSRRAASRPAGPPAAPLDAEPASDVAEPASDLAEPASDLAEPASDLAEATSDLAEPASDVAEPASDLAEPASAAEPAPAVGQQPVVERADAGESPLFQAPQAAAPPRRRRAASRPAGAPQPVEAREARHPEPELADPELPDPELADQQAPVISAAAVGLAHGPDDGLDAPDADEVGALDRAVLDGTAPDEPGALGEAEELLGAPSEDADVEDDPEGQDDPAEGEDAEGEGRSRRPRRRRGGRGRRRRGGDEPGEGEGATGDALDDELDEGVVEGRDAGTDGSPAGELAVVDGVSPVDLVAVSGVDRVAPDEQPATGDLAPVSDEVDELDGADGEPSDEDGGTGRRRRRRRSRSRSGGEPAGAAAGEEEGEAPSPASRSRARARRAAEVAEDVTAVHGSTRLEAKRQRRRDGRDGGRRRASISEAEFLARRESVERTMVVRSAGGRTQVAVLEDGVLVEHYVARQQHTSMIGNVHLGRVQNVLPSMEAAFVDIGRGRNAVLYAGEVDWDAAGLTGQAKRIESALKSGDPVLVQVSKDPIGHKGARLTSQVSLPGRYLVYVPNGSMTGISRKLPDVERSRLKTILRAVVPEDAGVIVRTAAEGASESELRRDVERLQQEWEEVSRRAKQVAAPTLLHGEPDLVIKVVRDVFNEDFSRLVVSGEEAWTAIKGYVDAVAPDLTERVVRWDGQGDAFAAHRIDEQIAKGLERKVWLPSGGSLVIDRTEAMTVVDVNTGRFTGSGGNLEETVTKNNLEAAEEIVRQLRLRDIGGIIVVDFIDMVLESNRDLVLRRLVECLGRDRTKHQVAEVTSLGLVQMTRKRVGQGLLEAFSEPCPTCAGRGAVVHEELLADVAAGALTPLAATPHAHSPAQQDAEPEDAPAPSAERSGRSGDAGPERTREDAARDAVRDAIKGVAQASRLLRGSLGDDERAAAVDQVAADLDAIQLPDRGEPVSLAAEEPGDLAADPPVAPAAEEPGDLAADSELDATQP